MYVASAMVYVSARVHVYGGYGLLSGPAKVVMWSVVHVISHA